MANQVNQSTALVPYSPQGAAFVQSEVVRGEQMVAGRFTGLDVMGTETAKLVSQVASTIIFKDPGQARHPVGGIIGGYCEDLRFVDHLRVGFDRRHVARFYTPNMNRLAFNNTPGPDYVPWARLAFLHVPNLAQAQKDFSARLKSAEEREGRSEVLVTRQPGDVRMALDPNSTAPNLSSADLRNNTDPDIQGTN